ncbi:MAG: energy transducer TonB [Sphingobacterium composti]|uniref:energy transducer TonB n=1 Tax=Sphingobacterium composti TaxID=363260 RepID=UPI0019167246|nr:hypothetical protein [Sphingobacterium composti Ten et al. 2007 non Yoo et al. 2007]
MKSFLLLGVMSFLFFNVFGQRVKIDTITKMSIEHPPQPKEGLQNFKNYMLKEFKISREMDNRGLKGKIMCSFIVEKDGSFSDIKVLEDLGCGTDKEAIRVLQKYSSNYKWIPRIIGGRYVRDLKEIAILLDLKSN